MRNPTLQARTIVWAAVNEYRNEADKILLEDVYIVSFTYILSNWKALVSTTIPDDRYYEVTHRAAGETYLDVYVKERNQVINVDDPVHDL
jgi:hypothetical protein